MRALIRLVVTLAIMLAMFGHLRPATAAEPTWDRLIVHGYTWHNPDTPWFNNHTQGLGLARSDGLRVGGYCNSYSLKGNRRASRDYWVSAGTAHPEEDSYKKCELSFYVGRSFETPREYPVGLGIAPVLATGYRHVEPVNLGFAKFRLMPNPGVNVRLGPLRVYALGRRIYHLTAEWPI